MAEGYWVVEFWCFCLRCEHSTGILADFLFELCDTSKRRNVSTKVFEVIHHVRCSSGQRLKKLPMLFTNTQVKKGRDTDKAALAISQTKSWWKMLEHLGNVKKRYHPWNESHESHGYVAGSVGRRSQRPRNWGTLKTVLSVAALLQCLFLLKKCSNWKVGHGTIWKDIFSYLFPSNLGVVPSTLLETVFFCIQTVARHWQIGRFGGWDAGARHEPSSGATTER